MFLNIRSHEPEGYYCRNCGQKNWPGTRCAKCGMPDPDEDKYRGWGVGRC